MNAILPSGLPEGPWEAVKLSTGWAVLTKLKRTIVVGAVADEKVARAIAALPDLLEGHARALGEATIAWACCALLHREYAKGKDALYTTRQADFLRHEEHARSALRAFQANREGE